MFATHAVPRLFWRAYAVNSTVLALATLALAVSPATVSFPIALAEALVLAGGLAATLGLNLALLRGMFGPGVRRRAGVWPSPSSCSPARWR